MRIPGGLLALLLGAAVVAAPALAAERKPAKKPTSPEKKQEEPARQTPAENASPYDGQLTRLSEIMGALAYLRDLCGDGDGADYRARMATLLDAEGGAPERREKFAGAYNRGYRGYEATYRSCTPNAHVVIARFLDEGGRIAHEISYRFGGS